MLHLKHETILTKIYIMMKRLLLLFVGLLAVAYLQAQTGWIEKNSNLPATKAIGQISAGLVDNNALWALPINSDGSIYDAYTKSIDGGLNWFPGTFNAGSGLSQLFAIDAVTCWAVFNTGTNQGLYKTVNGGTTWVKKGTAFGNGSFADAMHFFNINDGWAMGDPLGGYFEIYTTSDGGETWTRVPQANIPAIYASDEYGITGDYDAVGDHVWFGTNYGRVFHSADKGLHWTVSMSNFGDAETVKPEFADEMNGICYRSYLNLGIEPAIGVTTDGGATWTTVYVTGNMYARYIIYVPGTTGTYVGSSNAAGANGISYSTDGGYTWGPITEGYDFTATVWIDNATGWSGSVSRAAKTVGGMYIYDGPPLEPFDVPVISLSTDAIEVETGMGSIASETMTVSNIGGAELQYNIDIIYDMPDLKTAGTSPAGQTGISKSLGFSNSASKSSPNSDNSTRDEATLYYDGNNWNGIGWAAAPVTPTVAARFPAEMTLPYAGMVITAVDFWLYQNAGTNYKLSIFDMGNENQAGTQLVSQPLSGLSIGWNTAVLDNPVYITGGDIWVGYEFIQPDTGIYIPGIDDGTNFNPNGNYFKIGSNWGHISVESNWNIRASLTGTPIEQWLSVSPASGTLAPGAFDDLTVTCNATNLPEGTYHATMRFSSNDPTNSPVDVSVTLTVTGSSQSIVLDFESQTDWSMTFDPWTAVDIDGSATYGITGVEFEHSGEPMAFIAFNPATTVPPMTDDAAIQPHGGARFGACMASEAPTYENDDWIISPQITLGMNSSLTFWAKSYTDEWGLEKYNVLVSTTDMDPASFTAISAPPYMEAPLDWTEMYYDLSAYDGQTVYVAIQCVTTDAFIFMVDDISIDFTVGTPEMTEEVNISVYPNPATDHLNIISGVEMNQVEIFNQLGQQVFSQVVKNNNFNLSTSGFNKGVYYIRITTAQGIATEKVMVR